MFSVLSCLDAVSGSVSDWHQVLSTEVSHMHSRAQILCDVLRMLTFSTSTQIAQQPSYDANAV